MSNLEQKSVWPPVFGALAASAVALLFFVLPAEHGIDPTGLGGALGLTDMAEDAHHAEEFHAVEGHMISDALQFTLQPYENIEIKYRIAEDTGMIFSWTASAPVDFDMHAEPDGAEEGFAESFADGKSDHQNGLYHASFSGIHGWFWDNQNLEPVEVTLELTGFVESAKIFRDGFVEDRTIEQMGKGK